MKGGYQIIDLTNIDIVLGSEAVTITDNQVLKELLTLRDYIEDDYDYSKPLNRKLKPILLRLRDEKEGEEIEASLWANLSIIDDNLSFKIEGIINGKTITINVVFEKLQDDDGNDYYAIDEANLLLTNQQPIFENIIDKDGHARFIEGDITPDNVANIVWGYKKWALSGSHLLIVLCGTLLSGNTIADSTRLAVVNLPDWLKEKIYTIIGDTVTLETSLFFSLEYSAYGRNISLRKTSANIVEIRNMTGAITYTEDREFRIAFDLLIDNE